jgi:hypothetical protein
MKTEKELEQAHELLLAIITGALRPPLTEAGVHGVYAAASALCWVLGHEHNKHFGEQLARFKSYADASHVSLALWEEK